MGTCLRGSGNCVTGVDSATLGKLERCVGHKKYTVDSMRYGVNGIASSDMSSIVPTGKMGRDSGIGKYFYTTTRA